MKESKQYFRDVRIMQTKQDLVELQRQITEIQAARQLTGLVELSKMDDMVMAAHKYAEQVKEDLDDLMEHGKRTRTQIRVADSYFRMLSSLSTLTKNHFVTPVRAIELPYIPTDLPKTIQNHVGAGVALPTDHLRALLDSKGMEDQGPEPDENS
jgi:hypothetical protein